MLRLQVGLPERYRDADDLWLSEMIRLSKAQLGERLFILGHHYQKDEVMRWADARGDSFRLSVLAQERPEAEFIVFCGVHFMAESADILTRDDQTVILPDLNAGCSMADMANIEDVEDAWILINQNNDGKKLIPITYMNSSAAIKAFVGQNGGAVCTSTNARAVLEWAFQEGDQVLFFPDQHLGRNTGIDMGLDPNLDMYVYDPKWRAGPPSAAEMRRKIGLWKGHCSVHQRFKPSHIEAFRAEHPDGIVITHPECCHETCELADEVGSTDYIIKAIERAPSGSTIAVGTEIHLVHRLDAETPDKTIQSLDPLICPCSTMSRIDAPHLAWILEGLVQGTVRNVIKVDEETARWARVALERMLQIT